MDVVYIVNITLAAKHPSPRLPRLRRGDNRFEVDPSDALSPKGGDLGERTSS